METSTANKGAVGAAIPTTLRNTAPVTQAKAHIRATRLPAAGDRRRKVADHRPSAAAAEAGDPGRRVLAARQAGVGAEVGAAAVAGESVDAPWLDLGCEMSNGRKPRRIGMSRATHKIIATMRFL